MSDEKTYTEREVILMLVKALNYERVFPHTLPDLLERIGYEKKHYSQRDLVTARYSRDDMWRQRVNGQKKHIEVLQLAYGRLSNKYAKLKRAFRDARKEAR